MYPSDADIAAAVVAVVIFFAFIGYRIHKSNKKKRSSGGSSGGGGSRPSEPKVHQAEPVEDKDFYQKVVEVVSDEPVVAEEPASKPGQGEGKALGHEKENPGKALGHEKENPGKALGHEKKGGPKDK